MEQKKPKKVLPRKRVSIIRTMSVREGSVLYGSRMIRNPREAAEWMMPLVKNADKEYVIVCCLDGKSQPVSIEKVAVGTVDQCLMGMREIFKNAILCSAASILVFHNHPSGDATPSEPDFRASEKLRDAGALLDIEVLDHIVLGDGTFYSMAEELNWRSWKETGYKIA